MTVPDTTPLQPLGRGGEGIRTQKGTVVNLFGVAEAKQSPVTANGPGAPVDISGMNGAITLEVVKTGTGTCDILVEHTVNRWDEATTLNNWGNARMNPGETAGFPTPVAGNQAIGAGSVYQSWMLLETFPTIRVSVNSVSGTVAVQARLYMVPA